MAAQPNKPAPFVWQRPGRLPCLLTAAACCRCLRVFGVAGVFGWAPFVCRVAPSLELTRELRAACLRASLGLHRHVTAMWQQCPTCPCVYPRGANTPVGLCVGVGGTVLSAVWPQDHRKPFPAVARCSVCLGPWCVAVEGRRRVGRAQRRKGSTELLNDGPCGPASMHGEKWPPGHVHHQRVGL